MFTWFRSLILASALSLAGLVSAQNAVPPLGLPKKKVKQPAPTKPLPEAQPQTNGLPSGAVARLGKTRLRHADKVTCVAFSPDGKTIITGGDDGTLRVWSVATGDQLNMLQKPGQSVTGVRFTHGGQRIAMTLNDNTLRFLQPDTLKEIGSTPFINGHRFALSRDGAFLAIADSIGNATVTEVAGDLPKLEVSNASVFDFRPDGKAIAVGDAKGMVTVHLLTGGKPVFTVKQTGVIRGIAYSPDGNKLAVGSRSGSGTDLICIYEGKNQKPVAEIPNANLPQTWIGTESLACGNEFDAGVYNLAKKEWTSRVRGIAGEFAVSADGTRLAATGSGLRVRMWDLASGKQLHAENDSFPDPALLIGSADGSTLFLLSGDTAYSWRVGAEGTQRVGTLPGTAVAVAVNGTNLIVATPDAVLLYTAFDPTQPLSAKPTHVFKESAGGRAVAVSPNGKRVAWATPGGKVIVTDSAEKDARAELPINATAILALGFNPTGNRLGVLARDPYLRVWDVGGKAGEAKEVWKARVQRGQKGEVNFSSDGKYLTAVSTAQLLVFGAADGKVDGEIRSPLFHFERYTDQGQIQHARFSPDNRLLIVGSAGMYGRVEVWELATRDLVRAFVTGYGGTSRLCVFPDGTRVASAGAEEAVTVWDLTFRGNKPAPKADELLSALKDLSSSSAAVGYPAVKVFAAAGDRGTEHLQGVVRETLVTEQKIKAWVEELASNTFSVRENAAKELIAQGIRALPALSAAAKSDDSELRDRAREVLDKLNAKGVTLPASGMMGDTLRLYRAVQALEEIGTDKAKGVLKEIAEISGPPGEEAKAALARLKKK